MSTRIISALVLVILVAMVVVPAVADGTYYIPAVVISYEISSFGDFEVEAIDAEGEVWGYYADEAHIGDLVVLEVFDFEELENSDDEIVDVETITRLSVNEIVNWMK